MKSFEKYKRYLQKISDDKACNNYQKALLQLHDSNLALQNYKGISNKDLILGIKQILMKDLNTLSSSFTAASLSLLDLKQDGILQISKDYGDEMGRIIEGIFKIRSLSFSKAREQADMHRQLVLSVARDTRSILVLLAENLFLLRYYDQLHEFDDKEKVLSTAISVYIPIAHRLGLYKIKSEMEDLLLSIQEPEIYISIKGKLAEKEVERNKIINKFIAPLILEMNAHGLQYQIKSRLKSINSIYHKMKVQGVSFEKVYDLWAIRLILDSVPKKEKETCWHAYSIVTNLYEPNLNRMRDWITVPKNSGYESLHTTVKSEDDRWVEVQIRTTRMNEEAENGMAAHWKYKGGKMTKGIDFWLNEIRKAIGSEVDQLSQNLNPEKFANEVFIFTPGGDLKKLKFGATILDFAYAIHSEVGNKCTNAKVNGKIVPIKQVLRNGDQVEIITSKNQKPSIDWLKWVVSTRTKTKIRKALDEQKIIEIKRGKEILERKFKNWKMDFSQEVIDNIVNILEIKEHYDLFLNISLGKIDPLDIKKLLEGKGETEASKLSIEKNSFIPEISEDDFEDGHKDILIIDKIDNINFILAKCCNPIQGDKIFGFVTVTKGITIHRNKCPNAAEMKNRYPYRIIETRWKKTTKKTNFRASIKILGTDSFGLANRITQMISNDLKVNILSINFDLKNGLFEGKVALLVHDNQHLEILLERIKTINGVQQVFRLEA